MRERATDVAVLVLSLALVTACGGDHPDAPRATPSVSPSVTPTQEKMSRSEFLILVGSVCGDLAQARQVMHEIPTYNTPQDRAIGLRTVADVIDSTHDKMVDLSTSAPRGLEPGFHRSVVSPLARMTELVRVAEREYRALRTQAAGASIDQLAKAERPLVAYGRRYHLDQCGL